MRSKARALAVSSGLAAFGMGMLVPVLPRYAESLGASATLVGLLLAGFGVARLLVTLPAVWLGRRLGQRRVLVGSSVLTVPFAALCAVALGFWPLAVFCLAEGVLAATYAAVGTVAVVGDASPRRRGRSFASYQVAGLLGASLGPLAGGLIGQQLGLRAPFIFYAALAAGTAWWLHTGVDWTPTEAAGPPDAGKETEGGPAWRLLVAPGLLTLWLLVFVMVFTRTGVQLVAVPLLGAERLGLGPRAIGVALSLGGLAALVAFYPAGWLADRVRRKWVIAAGALGMAAALVLLAAGSGYAAFIASAILLGGAGSLVGPAPVAYLADAIPIEQQTTGLGLYRTIGDAGAALAPPLLGSLVDSGGFGIALGATAGLLAGAVVLFGWLAAEQRPTASLGRAPALQEPPNRGS